MNRPLRVAIDLRPVTLPVLSGIGLLVSQLLEELSPRGISFTGISDRPVPPGRLPDGIPVRVARAPGGRIRWEWSALPRALRSLEPPPDLFHATWNHAVPDRLPFPSLLSLHDLIPWRLPALVPWPWPAILHRALYRRAVRRSARAAAVIVTLSEASRRDITALVPEAAGKVEVIPCAVPRWFGRPAPEAIEAWRRRFGGRPYWLYLGGFDPRKGVGDLCRALMLASQRAARLPDVVLAGTGAPELERGHAEVDLPTFRLHRPGYVPDGDLSALFAGASLFLYPSRYEGFGIPPLLAMAAGVPAIVSDGGALPEVVGDAAIVVPAGDVAALSEALLRAASDPDALAPLAAKGRARAAAFTPEALAGRTIRAYERAVTRRAEFE